MKTNKFHELNRQFYIGSFTHPPLGGPLPAAGHLIQGSPEQYWKDLADGVSYASVRPYSSLDLTAMSSWTLTEDSKKRIHHDYGMPLLVRSIPQFIGNGYQYVPVFEDPEMHPGAHIQAWGALDCKTTIAQLIGIADVAYKKETGWTFLPQVQLLYIMKISWQHGDVSSGRSYDIYVPNKEQHAQTLKAHAPLLWSAIQNNGH